MRFKPIFGESFDVLVDRFLDRTEEKVKKLCPTLHKAIYKCAPSELILFRKILSIIPGYIIYLLLYMILLSRFSFHKNLQKISDLLIMLIIMLSYLVSVQFRAIAWLIIPTMLSKLFNIFFYVYIISVLLNVVGKTLTKNIAIFVKLFWCLFLICKSLFLSVSLSVSLSLCHHFF